jgi:cytochrome bd ubiquinol oxidase subunit II
MTLPSIVAAAMFVGVIIYAVFGGADFGSAFYDLTAGSGKPGAELRTFVNHSVGPVWEVNRVWLIYVLVMWWSGFPAAFAAAVTTLFIPLVLALIGIMLRGASFAFRKHAATFTSARLFGAVFAGSSLITPFFFGTVVGGIASGRVPASGYGDRVGSWINPTSLVCGGLAVTTCIFLAGVFLTADAAHAGNTPLTERLRKRTLAVGVLSGTIALAGVQPILHDAPTLSHGLLHTACPPLVAADIAGAFALILLYHRSYALARCSAVAAVAAVVTGWGVGQYPWILVDRLSIDDAAGAPTTLTALLVLVGLAAVVVLPALIYLFKLSQSEPTQRQYI